MNDRLTLLLLESPQGWEAGRWRLPGGVDEVGGKAGKESVDVCRCGRGEDLVGSQQPIGVKRRIKNAYIDEHGEGVHPRCADGSPGPIHEHSAIPGSDDDVVRAYVRVDERSPCHILQSPFGQPLERVEVPEDPGIAIGRRIAPEAGPPSKGVRERGLERGELSQFRRERRPGNRQQGIEDKVDLDAVPRDVGMPAFDVAEHQRDPFAVVKGPDQGRRGKPGGQRGCNGGLLPVDSRRVPVLVRTDGFDEGAAAGGGQDPVCRAWRKASLLGRRLYNGGPENPFDAGLHVAWEISPADPGTPFRLHANSLSPEAPVPSGALSVIPDRGVV